MEYVVRTAGILGEAIPLATVAAAIARVRATGRGSAPFNLASYKVSFDGECAQLLREADAGALRVCDDQSHPATPAEIYAKAGDPAPGNYPGRIAHLYTRIAYLNKWAHEAGDSYALHPIVGPWIEATRVEKPGSPKFTGLGEPTWAIHFRGNPIAKTKEDAASEQTPSTLRISSTPAPKRKIPAGGDSLTPLIWEICYDLDEAGKKCTAGAVMAQLKEIASAPNKRHPLMGTVAGGVAYESENGDQKELNSEQLRKRISEWKKAKKTEANRRE